MVSESLQRVQKLAQRLALMEMLAFELYSSKFPDLMEYEVMDSIEEELKKLGRNRLTVSILSKEILSKV